MKWSIPAYAGESGKIEFLEQVYPRACGEINRAGSTMRFGGPIPVYKGKLTHRTFSVVELVYPSVYRETSEIPAPLEQVPGLSPRVQGNKINFHRTSVLWVYPRACGGTACCARTIVSALGLSPRMQGNCDWAKCGRGMGRSIPTHAGKIKSQKKSRRVFPQKKARLLPIFFSL